MEAKPKGLGRGCTGCSLVIGICIAVFGFGALIANLIITPELRNDIGPIMLSSLFIAIVSGLFILGSIRGAKRIQNIIDKQLRCPKCRQFNALKLKVISIKEGLFYRAKSYTCEVKDICRYCDYSSPSYVLSGVDNPGDKDGTGGTDWNVLEEWFTHHKIEN